MFCWTALRLSAKVFNFHSITTVPRNVTTSRVLEAERRQGDDGQRTGYTQGRKTGVTGLVIAEGVISALASARLLSEFCNKKGTISSDSKQYLGGGCS